MEPLFYHRLSLMFLVGAILSRIFNAGSGLQEKSTDSLILMCFHFVPFAQPMLESLVMIMKSSG